jgi:eukaryotic-like serine/threonine-protein kinase
MPSMTGRVIAGRYILDQPIGRGAMGVVWRGHDQLLDREVAVKEVVLSSSIGDDERRNAHQRTLREARTAARLSHRGVVTVYDVAEEDGRPWIVMELVPSRSLEQVLSREGRMTALRAGRIGRQLLAALAAAHAAGVLHRDVKPSNVLIARERSGADWDERAVLTDFGIAQFEGDPRLTQTGMVMGSPGFTAPERIRGGAATPASDLWSFGATIYAAVEGRGPYEQRGGAITTMSAIINEDAPIASSAGPLAPVIAALLRREPSARPTAAAAARMFSSALPQLTSAAMESAHPATVRSASVPPAAARMAPAAEVADAALAAPAAPEAPSPEAPAAEVAGVAAGESAAEASESPAEVTPDSGIATGEPGEEALAAGGADGAADGAGDGDAVHDAAAIVAAALADMNAAEDGSADDAAPADPAAVGDEVPELAAAAAAGPPTVGPTSPEAITPEAITPEAVTPEPVQAEPAEAVQPEPVAAASVAPTSIDPVLDAPSFFASVPARTDPATTPEPKYEATLYGGSNAQRGSSAEYGSNAQRPAPDTQYAGPSRPYPDLPDTYSADASGRPRRGRRRRVIGLIAAALVIAAAAGGGAALALRHGGGTSSANANTVPPSAPTKFGSVNAVNNPSTALPSGWTTYTLQPSATGTTAGFSIDVPPGWTEKRKGLATVFGGPHGMLFEVDLTQHTYQNMAKEAEFIKRASLAKGEFPGYKQFYLQRVPIRGTNGAFWQFTWMPSGDVTQRTDDILFILQTQDGPQSYALYFRAPDSGWNSTYVPAFERILHTFQTVPS